MQTRRMPLQLSPPSRFNKGHRKPIMCCLNIEVQSEQSEENHLRFVYPDKLDEAPKCFLPATA